MSEQDDLYRESLRDRKELDVLRAEVQRLESALAAERARADAAERQRDNLLRSDNEIAGLIGTTADDTLADAVRRVLAERDAAETRANEEAANGAALRTALQPFAAMWRQFEKPRPLQPSGDLAFYSAHKIVGEPAAELTPNDLRRAATALALPASESLARVQALVEAARRLIELDASRDAGGLRADLHAALDAFAGHAPTGENR